MRIPTILLLVTLAQSAYAADAPPAESLDPVDLDPADLTALTLARIEYDSVGGNATGPKTKH